MFGDNVFCSIPLPSVFFNRDFQIILWPSVIYSVVGAIFLRAAAKWVASTEIKYKEAYRTTLLASVSLVSISFLAKGIIPEIAWDWDESAQIGLWILVGLLPIPIMASLLWRRSAIPIARAFAVASVAFIIPMVLIALLAVVYFVFF